MFVRSNNTAPDGDQKYPVGTLSWDVAANAIHRDVDAEWTLRVENFPVPAAGSATRRQDYVLGLTLADVGAKAAINEDRYAGPSITITSPAEGATVNANPLHVTGTAHDNRQLAGVTVNGQGAAVATDGSWTVDLALPAGPNTITATATDGAGNTATATRQVTVVPRASSTTTTSAPTTTTTTSAPTTTTTTLPCSSNPRCALDATTSPPCTGQTIPKNIASKLNHAASLVEQASTAPAKRAKRLRSRASQLLKTAGKAAKKAASGKHKKLSSECAAAISAAAGSQRQGLKSP